MKNLSTFAQKSRIDIETPLTLLQHQFSSFSLCEEFVLRVYLKAGGRAIIMEHTLVYILHL